MSAKGRDAEIIRGIRGIKGKPEWRVWEQQGRTPPGEHSVADLEGSFAALRNEDKRLANYYKLATGQEATPEIIGKYAQYASDPVLLTAAINKDLATTSFDTTTPDTTTGVPTEADKKRLKLIDTIKTTVQDTLGRAPTEAELGYFGKQMDQGAIDAYGLGDFLKGTSEYQNKYTDTARQKLAGELGGIDTDYMNKIQGQLESKYAAMGRKGGSSAFGSALIGAGKDLAQQRTGYLADIGYQGALSGQQSLKDAYQNRLAQSYANQQNIPNALGQSTQRYYSQQDQAAQMAAAERLRQLSQPRQGSFLQGLLPGVIQGAATIGGSLIGGPAGGYLGQKLFANKGVPAGGYSNLVTDYSKPGAW